MLMMVISGIGGMGMPYMDDQGHSDIVRNLQDLGRFNKNQNQQQTLT